MPEFRKDPIVDRWVILAAERAKRPQHNTGKHKIAGGDPCPFCAGNETMTPPAVLTCKADDLDPNTPDWSVRVVPNKYPALVDEGVWTGHSDSAYQTINGLGVHEVVIEAPQHVVDVATLNVRQLEQILHVYRNRIVQLCNDHRWRSILIYKNQGAEAGATLEHVHSQIITLPMVPRA